MCHDMGFWRKCRFCARWLRRTVLVIVVALIGVFIWCNQIGLPNFLKQPLVEKLRDRGIELEFSRLRLHLVRGLVAENVLVSDLKISGSPSLSFAEVQLQPDFYALLRAQLQIDGLVLRRGKLNLPLSPENTLSLENIQSELHCSTNDTVSLDNFKADFQGAKIALSGDIAHAPEIRSWEIFHGQKVSGHGEWRERLLEFSAALAKASSTNAPQLTLAVSGDARDPRSFIVKLAILWGKTHLQLDGGKNDMAQNYSWRARGAIEPEILRPFLTATNAVRALNHFTFGAPVVLDANISGDLIEPDSLNANGRIALTNLAVRGEAADNAVSDFSYTNRVLELFKPHLARGSETMDADQVTLDFNAKLIRFKNGFSTADPQSVARAIGPKTAKLMEPYHFLRPPGARVEGCVPLHDINGVRDVDDADISFEIVEGKPFSCLKLNAQNVTGTIHWLGETLILTNIAAQCYGGSGHGSAFFDFSIPGEGGEFQFNAAVSNINLHALAMDLSSSKNHLEGRLSGEITMTHDTTHDWQMMNGFGHAKLRDGLLWDIPVIGILSPILNMVAPGMGNSQATDAGGKFTIANGVIHSDSLEIDTTGARLQYDGTVDLKQNVHAHVTAQLLRNTPVIGQIISTIFWPVGKLFEYKVTGTLKNPKTEPVYVPRFLLMPLHPIRSIEELLPANEFFSNTNSAASN